HIWRLAQRVFQCDFIAFGIQTHFTLSHDTTLMLMHKFDRIFDRQDVTGFVAVSIARHRRHRGRFTRASRADHQHQTTLGNR
ncbi:hypothetical protein D039_4523B, partial [Vibrio parahaemolyticus EKP-028]